MKAFSTKEVMLDCNDPKCESSRTMKVPSGAKCTLDEEDNWNETNRIEKCSSMKKCYDDKTLKYDNDKCAKDEECASWMTSFKQKVTGCILKKYCWVNGFYTAHSPDKKTTKNDKVFYKCPNTR